jgi:hypothetical protein
MGEVVEDTRYLLVAPLCLRSRIMEMIDDEIAHAKAGEPAYLGFKLNGLTDKGIIDKLIEASQSGVKIELLVRGICCMVGGIEGVTDNIRVYSIVGRYLEHARIYIFGTKGRRKVYISSADFMTRNTMHRVEVAVPLYDDNIRHRVEDMFFAQLRDNVKLRIQGADGVYTYKTDDNESFNSQEYFYEEAYKGSWKAHIAKQEEAESASERETAEIAANEPEIAETPEPDIPESTVATSDNPTAESDTSESAVEAEPIPEQKTEEVEAPEPESVKPEESEEPIPEETEPEAPIEESAEPEESKPEDKAEAKPESTEMETPKSETPKKEAPKPETSASKVAKTASPAKVKPKTTQKSGTAVNKTVTTSTHPKQTTKQTTKPVKKVSSAYKFLKKLIGRK